MIHAGMRMQEWHERAHEGIVDAIRETKPQRLVMAPDTGVTISP